LRYDLLRRVLNATASGKRLLEIGPGAGAFAARAALDHQYCAVEQSRASARLSNAAVRRLGGRVICGDDSCIAPGARFDIVCAFEVLEHIEDDVAALSRWGRMTTSDGMLLISTPAFQDRFGHWDERAGHYRRYEPSQLALAARGAGLRVARIWTYGFPLGNLLERARHLVAGSGSAPQTMAVRTESSGRAFQPGRVMGSMMGAAVFPWRFLQRPFHSRRRGVGLIMLAYAEAARPAIALERLPRGVAGLDVRVGPPE
jgi:SAM-dependent methyltransferase